MPISRKSTNPLNPSNSKHQIFEDAVKEIINKADEFLGVQRFDS
jgi:hypothetical protein